jgi:hypothetical protein
MNSPLYFCGNILLNFEVKELEKLKKLNSLGFVKFKIFQE